MSSTQKTAAPITARKLAKGWLYQQGGVTVRKSAKGGDAYAYATTINGAVANFCGTLKSANSEAAKLGRIRDAYRATLVKHVTLGLYRAHRYTEDQANREWCLANGGEPKLAEHMEWFEQSVATDWQRTVETSAWVIAIVPIAVVEA
jgi:hypothetical protein